MYLPTQIRTDELAHYGVKGMTWGGHTKAQVKPGQKTPPSDQQLMADVLAGKYGNGADRKKKLGNRYAYVQDMVNQKILGKKYKTKFPKKSAKHTKGKAKVAKMRKKMATKKLKDLKKAQAAAAAKKAQAAAAAKKATPQEIEKAVPKPGTISHSDELAHYGVKGMHWGVRKHQAKVPKGPEHVVTKVQPGKRVKAAGGKRLEPHEDAIRAATERQKARKSTTDSLSDKELQHLINRMNMEQQYARLANQNQSPIKRFVGDLVKKEGSRAANDIGKKAAGEMIKKAAAKKG